MTSTEIERYKEKLGTCYRGNGRKVHLAFRGSVVDENGKESWITLQTTCNYNGQTTGQAFIEGRNSRKITCGTCNRNWS